MVESYESAYYPGRNEMVRMGRSLSAIACCVVALAWLGSCGPAGSERVPDDATGEEDLATAEQELLEGVVTDPEVCSGTMVPPTGYRQETAFVAASTPAAADEAAQRARERLRDLICQGYRCEQAESIVTIWRVGSDGRQVCVMAVASVRAIHEFESGPRRQLTEGLQRVAQRIAEGLQEDGVEAPAVVIDTINDHGVNGGPRAEWLHDQLLGALATNDVDTRRPPARWTGLGLPPATTGVIRGTIRELPGREAILQASWRLELEDRRVRSVGDVEFPLAISPEVDRATYMPPLPRGTGKVSLHVDSRPGGALCEGQETELWLESSEPVFVRVLNLYGQGDGGLMVYSTGSERLEAHHPVSLGNFTAVRTTDIPVERLLVVASPNEEDLGRFGSLDSLCRLPGSMSQALHEGREIPAETLEWLASLDYRIMSGEGCEGYEAPRGQDYKAVIAALPACWSGD